LRSPGATGGIVALVAIVLATITGSAVAARIVLLVLRYG
jgi:hypothetical protein